MLPTEATVPLTDEQRNWLRVNAIFPALFAIPIVFVIGAVLLFIARRFHALPVTIFACAGGLLLIAVTAGVALHVRNNLRDLQRGVAHVVTARLLSKRATGRNTKSFYATLEHVGDVIVMHDLYATLSEQALYRVTYSPSTKRCWSATNLSYLPPNAR
ncbi:MAG TPA: hypothetical protein VFN10_05225 [Thermoanaerobaculia bacterium]|nr:hypothetical protein [Thermoanaerobaculia bacterium]